MKKITTFTSGILTVLSILMAITTSAQTEQISVVWEHTFGESNPDERVFALQASSDGGMILVGNSIISSSTWAEDGVSAGESMSTTQRKSYGYILNVTPQGVRKWEKRFHKPGGGSFRDVQMTSDGGVVVVGWMKPQESKYNFADMWIIKLDSQGNPEWERTFEGKSSMGGAGAIQAAVDGGYVVAGAIGATGKSQYGMRLFKLSPQGELEWERIVDEHYSYSVSALQTTPDGGYIVAGVTHLHGKSWWDMWVMKFTEQGESEWEQVFGGEQGDSAHAICTTPDGGYIVAGQNTSERKTTTMWVMKLNERGEKIWEHLFERGTVHDIRRTPDGGYILAGEDLSSLKVVKLNEQGDLEWSFEEKGKGDAYVIHPLLDEGYIVGGATDFHGYGTQDALLMKLKVDHERPSKE